MKKNIAVTVLTLVLAVNMGSGYTQRIDHRLSKIESSLSDRLDDRVCAEQVLEAERKVRYRVQASFKQ